MECRSARKSVDCLGCKPVGPVDFLGHKAVTSIIAEWGGTQDAASTTSNSMTRLTLPSQLLRRRIGHPPLYPSMPGLVALKDSIISRCARPLSPRRLLAPA